MPGISKFCSKSSGTSSNNSRDRICSPKTPTPTPTFCLSGSQLSLTPRPGNSSGRASVRSVSIPRRRRPMSAVTYSSTLQQNNRKKIKPRPKSADISKIKIQGHSIDDECFVQTWQDITGTGGGGETSTSSPNTICWTSPEFTSSSKENTPEHRNNSFSSGRASLSETFYEKDTELLLDKLLQSTVEQTKKQLRFAVDTDNPFKLEIPEELLSKDLTNPTKEFIDTIVTDVKHTVRSTLYLEDTATNNTNNNNLSPIIQESFESQKIAVQQLFHNNTEVNRNSCSKHNQNNIIKPKTIQELLEIIDKDIPIEFRNEENKATVENRRGRKVKKVKAKENKEKTSLTEILNEIKYVAEIPSEATSKEEEKNGEIKNEQTVAIRTEENEDSENVESLTDILKFLDQVERNDIAARLNENHDIKKSTVTFNDQQNIELKGCRKESVEITALKQAIQERSAHVELLKEALRQARIENASTLAELNKQHKQSQRKLKNEQDLALRKLQDGMDKLTADKQQLVEKVEALLQQIRSLDGKHQTQIQTLQQRHSVEITRAKQLAAAAEKVRREKWVERQTARIKELTVKGLEPELTRLNLQHENKIAQIQAAHSRELQHQIEAEAKHIDELRIAILRDKDEEIARERTLLTQRFERQIHEERGSNERRCQRIMEEGAAEASRIKSAWQAQRESTEAETKMEIQRLHTVHEQHIAQIEERKEAEIAAEKEQMKEEQRSWLASQIRIHNEILATKQQELKEERDVEIERAIDRLEGEERNNRIEMERDLQKKLQRLCEQHAAILSDRELSERLLKARLEDAQKAMEDSEKQLLSARAAESRLRQELCISTQRVEALEADQLRIRENIEKQFISKITELEMSLQQQKTERKAELEQVHTRLKGVLEKKDEHIDQLKKQLLDANIRCRHLESLLGRQPLN